jgi:hypothetical protein
MTIHSLRADKRSNNPKQLAIDCIRDLDKDGDGKVSKGLTIEIL